MNDRGSQDNALNLSSEVLKKRQVEMVDIANDELDDKDFESFIHDPKVTVSKKTKRGPLKDNWIVKLELLLLLVMLNILGKL